MQIENAIISVSDKRGLEEFSRFLDSHGVRIFSTGGTSDFLSHNGVMPLKISDYTDFPEIMGGRVKTLHPKVFGGILHRSKNEEELELFDIVPFDMVVVNLYPFEETVKSGEGLETVIENIDVGGVSLIRAAAKNYKNVLVLTSPDDYRAVMASFHDIDTGFRERMAQKAFNHTMMYDYAIYNYLKQKLPGAETFSSKELIPLDKLMDMKYGENKHQKASFYSYHDINSSGDIKLRNNIAGLIQVFGDALSYNNIIDCNDALELIKEFDDPAAAIIKHTNPCGLAISEDITRAFELAYEADPVSPFGGIIAVNREVETGFLKLLKGKFFDVIIAPGYSDEALKSLGKKKKLKVLICSMEKTDACSDNPGINDIIIRGVNGGCLLQTKDDIIVNLKDLKVVTKKVPLEKEMKDMITAFTVCKHVKSNSIVIVKDGVAIGIGAGQMSRVDAVELAIKRSRTSTDGAVMASDAFFPFPDAVEKAAEAGITAIIQPGGSIRDNDAIATAEKAGISMIFTDVRHFKH